MAQHFGEMALQRVQPRVLEALPLILGILGRLVPNVPTSLQQAAERVHQGIAETPEEQLQAGLLSLHLLISSILAPEELPAHDGTSADAASPEPEPAAE